MRWLRSVAQSSVGCGRLSTVQTVSAFRDINRELFHEGGCGPPMTALCSVRAVAESLLSDASPGSLEELFHLRFTRAHDGGVLPAC